MSVFSSRDIFRLFVFHLGEPTGSGVLDLLVRVRHPDGRRDVESVHQGRPAGLGGAHSDRERLFSVQSRRASRLVADPNAHSAGQFHHPDHSGHRCREELRERCRFWHRIASVALYFLSDPRIRQRAIPRRSTAATGLSQALLRPVRFPSFVKRSDAFARLGGFARAHVMLQRKIDIFPNGGRPQFFDQTLGLRERIGSALQN